MNHFSLLKQHVAEIYGSTVSCAYRLPLALGLGMFEYLLGVDNKSAVTAVLVLIGFDFVTAIMAKYKIGEAIESRKALKTVSKIAVYGVLLSSAHLTETIVPGTTFLDGAALSFLALTELISIIENIGKMGYAIPQKMLNKLEAIRDK